MEQGTIEARRIGRAVVVSLSDRLSAADPVDATRALLAAAAESPLVVLDLSDVDLLSVRTARVLVAFAQAGAARDVECVLLVDPAHTAATAVLASVDPHRTLPRFTSLDDALAHRADNRPRTGPDPVRPGSTVNTLAFDSVDLGRTEEFLSSSYAPMRIGSATGRAGTHITRVAAGSVSADRLDLSFDMSYDVEPLGRICLCDIETGTITDHRVAGWREAEAFGPGELFSFAPPDRPYSGQIRHARYSITMFDPALLDEVAGRPVRLLDHHPLDPAAAAQLRAAIRHLRDDVLGMPQVGENPLVVAAASRYLATSVLTAFPTSLAEDEAGPHGEDAHSRTLRRAIAFIEANADRDISAVDIATAARVSVRAVQLAFRRHLDLTPMAYLRQVRLDCARAELRAAVPGRTTVGRVAARWGYAHQNVFAARYRSAFGESPSQTLRDTGDARPPVRFRGGSGFAIDAKPADPVVTQFDGLTARLLAADTVEDVLRCVADAAKQLVPSADLVAVTVRDADGSLRTPICTDPVAAELDQVQHTAGRGPVLDVTRPGGPSHVSSGDLPADQRWPEFAAAGGAHGFHALIAVDLLPAAEAGQPASVLTLYSRRADGLGLDARDTTLLLATHGSLALANARTAELADRERAQLLRAVASRDVIGQAKGILMSRHALTADEAFELLSRTSQRLNLKLTDLARTLVDRLDQA